jgi:hypothetical protein
LVQKLRFGIHNPADATFPAGAKLDFTVRIRPPRVRSKLWFRQRILVP